MPRIVENGDNVFRVVDGYLVAEDGRNTGLRWPDCHRFMVYAKVRDETAEEREAWCRRLEEQGISSRGS